MMFNIIFYNKKSNYNFLILIFSFVIISGTLFIIRKSLKKRKTLTPELNSKFIEFENKIIDEKIFTNNSVNLKSIARSMSMKSHDLNELIIKSTGDNFYTYMNRLRVKEFISIINSDENKKLNIVYVAEKCGFGSKASFYRIFKEITGESPTKYREDV